MGSKGIHSGHRSRLKKRYMEEDLDNFQPHQILEMLLFYAVPRKDTNELAHKLISAFGSISGVFDASVDSLVKKCGISENTAILITMIPSLSRAYSKDKWGDRPILKDSLSAGSYALSLFSGRLYEALFLICLDSNKRVRYTDLIYEGTIDETPYYPRLIIESAIRHNSHSIILTHNHPSGNKNPSAFDLEATVKMYRLMKTIDIDMVDHIIVAESEYLSMADLGYIEKPK